MAFTAADWGQGLLLTGLSPGSSLTGHNVFITKANLPTSALDTGSLSCLSNGGDWRFSSDIDGNNELDCEIVDCVTSTTASSTVFVAEVRFPTYAGGTRSLYAFWNKAGESRHLPGSSFGSEAALQDYEAVIRANETGTNGVFYDSTGNGHSTTLTLGSTLGTTTTGNPFGLAWPDFTTAEALTMTSSGDVLNSSAFAVTMWMNSDVSSQNVGVFSNRYSFDDDDWIQLNSNGKAAVKGATSEDLANGSVTVSSTSMSVLTHDATSLDAIVNGSLSATDTTISNTTGIVSPATHDYRIGTYYDNAGSRRYNGRVSEIRLRKIKYSVDRSESLYDNQSDPSTFWTLGSVFVPSGSTTPITGSASIAFSAAAALVGLGLLTGASSIAFTPSATLTGLGSLAGSSDIAVTASATLTDAGAGALSGSASITVTASATLTGLGSLAGSSDITVTPTATLTGLGSLAGSSDITVTPTATLTGLGSLAGSSNINFVATSTLTNDDGLSGSASISFVASATLTGLGSLSGESFVDFAASATLSNADSTATPGPSVTIQNTEFAVEVQYTETQMEILSGWT
jgi:hypothetical protein